MTAVLILPWRNNHRWEHRALIWQHPRHGPRWGLTGDLGFVLGVLSRIADRDRDRDRRDHR